MERRQRPGSQVQLEPGGIFRPHPDLKEGESVEGSAHIVYKTSLFHHHITLNHFHLMYSAGVTQIQ